MSRTVLTIKDVKQEQADFAWTMGQITGSDGNLLTVEQVTAVALFVYDKANPKVIIYQAPLDPASVFFGPPRKKNDGGTPSVPWTSNALGCNFAHYLRQADVFVSTTEQGGHVYRMEYRFTTTTSGIEWAVRECTSQPITTQGGGSAPPPLPDFALSSSATSGTISVGGSLDFTISSTPLNGFASNVSLSTSALPTGIAIAFVTNPIAPNGSTVMHLTSTNPNPGSQSFDVIGTAGTLVHRVTIQMQVTAGDFTISLVPLLGSIPSGGGSQVYTVTIAGNGGFNQPVTLSSAVTAPPGGYPIGMTAAFGTSPITPTGTPPLATTTFTITSDNRPTDQIYSISVTGTFGSISHSTGVQLNKGNAPTGGFTVFTPSSDSRLIYVDFTGGNDTSGAFQVGGVPTDAPLAPYKTLAAGKAQLRPGFPDWLLFKCGEQWTEALGQNNPTGPTNPAPLWGLHGRSAAEPMVVTTYNNANGHRPFFKTGNNPFYSARNDTLGNYWAIMGLEIFADTYDPLANHGDASFTIGIVNRSQSRNMLIEDCCVHNYAQGMYFEAFAGDGQSGGQQNTTVRRNIVYDNWGYNALGQSNPPPNDNGQNDGNAILFGNNVNGILCEENFMDRNGWSGATLPNGDQPGHQPYINNNNTGVTYRRNISARGDGPQIRCGGEVSDNLSLNLCIAYEFGAGTNPNAYGVTGRFRGNVALEGNDFPHLIHGFGGQRGWGLVMANVYGTTGTPALVEYNIFAHQSLGTGARAWMLNYTPAPNPVGMLNCLYQHNIILDWQLPDPNSFSLVEFSGDTGHGVPNLTNQTFLNNAFEDNTSTLDNHKLLSYGSQGRLPGTGTPGTSSYVPGAATTQESQIQWAASNGANLNEWFRAVGGDDATHGLMFSNYASGGSGAHTFTAFKALMSPADTVSLFQQHAGYADKTRTIASYCASNAGWASTTGQPTTLAGFCQAARNRGRGIWASTVAAGAVDAHTVNEYIRAGFNMTFVP